MSFGGMEHLWNSVDVRGDDGLLHHGRVIDTASGGLMVDFGGTGVSVSKVVPFGQIYRCTDSNYLLQACRKLNWQPEIPINERPVEVLLRAKRADPWKWYPGMLISADFSSGGFGFVSITLDNQVLKGIVAGNRIRGILSEIELANRQVTVGQFLKMRVAVQSECASALTRSPDAHLLEMFNANCQMGGYGMMATYVHSTDSLGLMREMGVLGSFDDCEWMLLNLSKNGFSQLGCETLLLLLNGDFLENLRPLSPQLKATAVVSANDGDLHSLLPHILLEIFQCLTPLERADLCGVCKTWQAMLSSSTVQRVLMLTATDDSYEWAACLYNCWNEQTKVLVLHGNCIPRMCDDGRMVHIVGFMVRVMAERALPAFETVLLIGMKWSVQFYRDDWASALYSDLTSLAAICHNAIWYSIIADLGPGLRIVQCGPLVDRTSVRIRRQFTTGSTINDLWDLLNGGLPDLDAQEMDLVAEWLRHPIDAPAAPPTGAYAAPSRSRAAIVKILQYVQISDPREGVRYRERSFHLDGATDLEDIDVAQLTKLTQQALLQYVKKRDIPWAGQSIPLNDLPHQEDDIDQFW